jgi:DegV family protein with EDD domain
MAKVAVVTDSTSNLPPEVIGNLPVFVVPLHVIWGDSNLLDGVDITPDQFYVRLKSDKNLPTTSQPTPAAFKSIFVRLLEEGYDVLTITISAKLSGTMDSATQAKAMLPGPRIELVDSMTTSLAMGFQVLAAARAAIQGASLKETLAVAEKARANTGIYFVLNTLDYLHRGGRIGGAAAFVGTLLNLKPILEVRDGRIEPLERVRTSSKAIDRLLDLFDEKVRKSNGSVRVCTLHTDTPTEAQELLNRAKQRFGTSEIVESFVGQVPSVLGVHTGPGALGIGFMTGM